MSLPSAPSLAPTGPSATSGGGVLGGAMSQAGSLLLVAAVAAATALAVTVGGGEPVLAILPAGVVTVAYLMATTPLRLSAAALLLLLLGLEDHLDHDLQWRSPLAILGDLLHSRLDAVVGGPAITGMEIVLAFLFIVGLRRRLVGSRIDAPGPNPPAAVLGPILLFYLGGVLLAEAVGLARGYSLAPWKLRNLLHPVALGLFFLFAFRAERDRLMAWRLVVLAALARAGQAVLVQEIATIQTGGPMAHATSHGDSVLFALALFILVADAAERPTRRRIFWLAVLAPVVILGAVENNRRILWVMLGMMAATWYLMSPMRGWKRSLTRGAVLAAPVLALYLSAGWESQSRIFAPVRVIRGVSDTSTDRSAYWREVENWNISVSIRDHPFLGTGLGGEYTELMANDDVSAGFKEYREWPHNTILGQLLLLGLFGFTAVWLLPALVVFLSVRSYWAASTGEQRVSAACCMAAVVSCQVLAWGDTGAHFPQYKVVLGLALAQAARLAVVTGAWPAVAGDGSRRREASHQRGRCAPAGEAVA